MAKVHIIVSRRVTFMEEAIVEIDLPDFIVEDRDALCAVGVAYANSHCDDLQNLPFEKVDHPQNRTTPASLSSVEPVRELVVPRPPVEIFELREAGTDIWRPVTRDEWIAVERQSGFQPKGIAVDDPAWRTTCATAGFGGQRYDGRIRYQ